ncbi:tobe domain protein [Fulvivirga imtechensis AK7]|uniref:Tobe domain protein n=1 Tax=Fulvivirga imtechensis AK7 TaxID=1237149 RepID=L8K1V3_9BACT|nr:TOBE domain-containing protein [Fulvivirga imtechensis]ELR73437.1 tobe domain protein [Fulvivirga imtechensis AK7]
MNILTGKITAIEVSGSLSLVTAVAEDVVLKSIVIETPETASYLQEGRPVKLLFKETEVIIGVGNLSNISLQNRIAGTVSSIEKGSLISRLVINTRLGEIVSVITTRAVEQLNIDINAEVKAMIKTNEMMLSE